MQKKVQIISDGSQDLSPELSKEKDIDIGRASCRERV